MKKINIELTENEYRAFLLIINHGYFLCQSSCAYSEMRNNKISCDECKYTKARQKLESIFSK